MKGIVCIEGGGTPHTPNLTKPFVGLESGTELIQNALYRLFEQEIPNLKTSTVLLEFFIPVNPESLCDQAKIEFVPNSPNCGMDVLLPKVILAVWPFPYLT